MFVVNSAFRFPKISVDFTIPFLYRGKMAQESCNLDKEEAEVLKPSSSTPPPSLSPSPSPPVLLNTPKEISAERRVRTESSAAVVAGSTKNIEESQLLVRLGNRCSSCQKRVGLTGFRCRCGDLFCTRHRYSETHNCSFDYKASGREEIFKANPVVRAAKIIKI